MRCMSSKVIERVAVVSCLVGHPVNHLYKGVAKTVLIVADAWNEGNGKVMLRIGRF